jgi:hypothetical protein
MRGTLNPRLEMEVPMRPTTAPDTNDSNVFDIDLLLRPAAAFEHPKEVLSRQDLSVQEKRAILSSWASDAAAVASCPALRAPEELRAPVAIDDILDALKALDGGPGRPPRNPSGGKPFRLRSVERLLAA